MMRYLCVVLCVAGALGEADTDTIRRRELVGGEHQPNAARQKKKIGDPVTVIANKVGPHNNPTETYTYYSLPFCKPEEVQHQDHQLGEVLLGDRKQSTDYALKFQVDVTNAVLCHKSLDMGQIKEFYRAVDRDYTYEMYLDGLPMWGYVGEYSTDNMFLEHTSMTQHFVHTHIYFQIGHNDGQVVDLNVTFGEPPDYLPIRTVVSKDMQSLGITFTYSAHWFESDIKYEDRMERFNNDDNTQEDVVPVHWIAIINSFILVLLLTVMLSVILVRTVRNDFSRYMGQTDDIGLDEETGWKLIHGDVFRTPPNVMLLVACVGVGSQLLLMTVLVVLLALLDVFDPVKRGNVMTATIVTYSLTSGVGGYVSARLYRQLEGEKWVWNIVSTALLLPGPLLVVFAVLNTTAIVYGSTAALPFATIMVLITLYACISFPLTVVGGIAGKNSASKLEVPGRINLAPREMPKVPWYRDAVTQTLLAGALPFSAIYIEVFYIFASIWGHKIYTVFGVLAVALTMLLFVTSFVTISFTYFQLIAEDYKWWWRSFFAGGAAAIYLLIYCVYYFFHKTAMDGFMQTAFYFGYMLTATYMFALALGALGFYSSFFFVHYIYNSIKCD